MMSPIPLRALPVGAKRKSRYSGSERNVDPAIGALWNVYPVGCAAYSSGVGGTIVLGPAPQRPVKFMAMRSEAHLTGIAPADGTKARDIFINSQ
jgi:hypothetical protein